MELKMSNDTGMQEIKRQSSLLSAVHPKGVVLLRHKRSKSDSCQGVKEDKSSSSPEFFQHLKLDMGKTKSQMNIKKAKSPVTGSQCSLKREIRQLEKRLQDQFVVRHTLERALGDKSSAIASSYDTSIPKPTKELIKEIAALELEVMYLEQYLLSLYRKAFDRQVSIENRPKWSTNSSSQLFRDVSILNISAKRRNEAIGSSQTMLPQESATNPETKSRALGFREKPGSQSVRRSQSLLSHCSVCPDKLSPSQENQARTLWSCHSQSMTLTEHGQNGNSGVTSLADFFGTSIADHVPKTPNRLSEDMVRCIVAIYCKLRDPPLFQQQFSSSPSSSFSSVSACSPRYLREMWSPGFKRRSTFDACLDNPFGVEGLKEFSGPYNAMVEVHMICTDSGRLSAIKEMLHKYKNVSFTQKAVCILFKTSDRHVQACRYVLSKRYLIISTEIKSLIHRLEMIDPRVMKNEEKLAFWINIHNAFVMHAYLDHGIPQSNTKRASLLTKASYIIGGCAINAYVIQNSILGCCTNLPGQWLRTLVLSKLRFKNTDQCPAYGIERSEPLLHFALCSGSHSDPAVRIYTAKTVFQQLEAAREEYIRATVSIHKEEKLLLPKLIDAFAKETGLSREGLLEMIRRYLPETSRIVTQRCPQGRSHKIIAWVPHNFTFRYLLSKELAIPHVR